VPATEDRFPFRFTPAYRWAALPFGITPSSAWVRVEGEMLHARFGPWFVHVPLANVIETQASGPYSPLKTAGPAHLSFADRVSPSRRTPSAGCASGSTSRWPCSTRPAGFSATRR